MRTGYFLLQLSICALFFVRIETERRRKRVIDGLPLYSLQNYDLRFVVALRSAWGCAGSIEHDFFNCASHHACTGSLIHREFVLTACHCAVSDMFEVKSFRWLRFWIPYHPLYNSIIIRAGTASNALMDDDIPNVQRRHAMSFLTHSNCTWSSIDDDFSPPPFDVALVKSCEPFELNNYVQVAVRYRIPGLESQFERVVQKGTACLWAGFGSYDLPDDDFASDTLRYMFRYVTCHTEPWSNPLTKCSVSSSFNGPYFKASAAGDSGCPVICNRWLFAVHSAGFLRRESNISSQYDTPLSCFQDYITTDHLENLKKLTDSTRHVMEGRPYGRPYEFKRRSFFAKSAPPRLTFYSAHTSNQQLNVLDVSVLFINLLIIIWSQCFL